MTNTILTFPHGYRIEQQEPEGWAKAFAVFTPTGKQFCYYRFLNDAVDYVESKRTQPTVWNHNAPTNDYFIG